MMRPVQVLSGVFLVLLLAATPAHAHTLITVTAEMVSDGDNLTITLNVSPMDIIACLAPKGQATYGLLRNVDPRLAAYLVEHVVLRVDGVPLSGRYGGYLPDLLAPTNRPADSDVLPEKMPFVLIWTLPHASQKITLSLTLFLEEGLPGISTLALNPGGTSKRQVAYVELGKAWTFPLHPGSSPSMIPSPPDAPAQQAAETTISWSATQAYALGFRHAWCDVPFYLLLIVVILLRACEWRPWLWSMGVFALAQLVAFYAVSTDLLVLSRGVVAVLGCCTLVLAAIITMHPRTGTLSRLLLFAGAGTISALGLGVSVTQAVGLGAVPAATDIALTVGIASAELLVMGQVIGVTVWFWNRPWYRRWLVVPGSLMIAAAGTCWIIQRAWMMPV